MKKIEDCRILIVDDEEDIRSILARFFNKLGAKNIFTAENGLEAKEKIQEILAKGETLDIIISDITMPMLSGTELLKWTKNNKNENIRKIFFVLITGFSVAEITGANAFLQKPFDLLKIKEMIEAL